MPEQASFFYEWLRPSAGTKNLAQAIETVRKLYPEIEFIHSDFETYAKAVKAEMTEQTSTVVGELTSQETDGRWTLVNTCSANADLKIANRKGESALKDRQSQLMQSPLFWEQLIRRICFLTAGRS